MAAVLIRRIQWLIVTGGGLEDPLELKEILFPPPATRKFIIHGLANAKDLVTALGSLHFSRCRSIHGTILHHAVLQRELPMLRYVLTCGIVVDPDKPGVGVIDDILDEGITPLHCAVDTRLVPKLNVSIVSQLLDHGANVNSRTHQRSTPLIRICEAADSVNPVFNFTNIVKVMKLLLQHGASINATNSDGQTALILACYVESPEMVQCLLEHGADPNIRDKEQGRTALHVAADFDHVATVKLLLKHGARLIDDQRGVNQFICAACYHSHKSYSYMLLCIPNISQQDQLVALVLLTLSKYLNDPDRKPTEFPHIDQLLNTSNLMATSKLFDLMKPGMSFLATSPFQCGGYLESMTLEDFNKVIKNGDDIACSVQAVMKYQRIVGVKGTSYCYQRIGDDLMLQNDAEKAFDFYHLAYKINQSSISELVNRCTPLIVALYDQGKTSAGCDVVMAILLIIEKRICVKPTTGKQEHIADIMFRYIACEYIRKPCVDCDLRATVALISMIESWQRSYFANKWDDIYTLIGDICKQNPRSPMNNQGLIHMAVSYVVHKPHYSHYIDTLLPEGAIPLYDVVVTLHEMGMSLNDTDFYGNTPLHTLLLGHKALLRTNPENVVNTMEYFCKNGVGIDIPNYKGYTSLDLISGDVLRMAVRRYLPLSLKLLSASRVAKLIKADDCGHYIYAEVEDIVRARVKPVHTCECEFCDIFTLL